MIKVENIIEIDGDYFEVTTEDAMQWTSGTVRPVCKWWRGSETGFSYESKTSGAAASYWLGLNGNEIEFKMNITGKLYLVQSPTAPTSPPLRSGISSRRATPPKSAFSGVTSPLTTLRTGRNGIT